MTDQILGLGSATIFNQCSYADISLPRVTIKKNLQGSQKDHKHGALFRLAQILDRREEISFNC